MLGFSLKREGLDAIVELSGAMTAENLEEFRTELKAFIGREIDLAKVVINMAQVEIIDSTGVGLLAALHNSLESKKSKLEVVDVSTDIYNFFINLRLHKHFTIKPKEASN